MKRLDFPLWSDTAFVFFTSFLLFFCIFRFYLSALWSALCCALAASGASAVLFFFFLRARRRKKHAGEWEKSEIGRLAFHLAMDSPEHNAALIAKCLSCAREEKPADGKTPPPVHGINPTSETDNGEYERSPEQISGQTDAESKNRRPSKQTHSGQSDTKNESGRPSARICGGRIDTDNGSTYLKFQFEKVTADELSPVIRADGEQKTVLGTAFTDEAQKLAEAFGVKLKDAAEVYTLVKESGCMPETLISPPEQKRGLWAKLSFRIRRDAWRGYLFSGVFLLLFSLFTIFPVYYLVSGGILLAVAAAVRFFGKKD